MQIIYFISSRTPSKQKSPKESQEIDIVELLRNVDPKEYEKYARMYGITDFRGLLQAIEQLKREKEEESGRPVSWRSNVENSFKYTTEGRVERRFQTLPTFFPVIPL